MANDVSETDFGTSPDDVQFRFRDDEVADHAQVTVDSFLEQSNAAAVRIEPGDDARALLPHLERLRLIEVNSVSLVNLFQSSRST